MVEIKYVPSICPYCGTGCGINFVVKDGKIIGVEPWKRHPVNEGKVCPKGNFGYQFITIQPGCTLGQEDPLEKGSTSLFLPGQFHGQRSLVGYCPWGCTVGHN